MKNSETLSMVTRNSQTKSNKSTYKWTHCNQTSHTKNCCFEIVGYSKWWDHNRDLGMKNTEHTSTTAIIETNVQGKEAKSASS